MKLLQFTVLLSAVFLFGCSGSSDRKNNFDRLEKLLNKDKKEEVSTDPINVELGDVFANDYDRKQVLIFEGYIGLIPTTVSFSGGTMDVKIFERRNQNGGSHVNLDIKLGTSHNNVHKLPEQYKQEDLIVITDNGKEVGVGAKVRVTATGYYSSRDYYSMDAIKIEAVNNSVFDKSVFEHATKLTSDLIHDTSRSEVYSYMDGTFSIPSVFYSMYGDIALDFKTSTNTDFKKVDMHVGSGPSTMNELPASYTPKDLVLRDVDGNEIPAGSKVRVYGTWERYSFVSSTGLGGKFYVEELVKL